VRALARLLPWVVLFAACGNPGAPASGCPICGPLQAPCCPGTDPSDGTPLDCCVAGSLAGSCVSSFRCLNFSQAATVAGLGNIYVNEALHRARIDPRREAGGLGRAKLKRLVDEIRAVLDEAIEAGGSTLRDYAGADGAPGYFQHTFRVYGRAGEACPTRGCKGTVERIVQNGRSTFYCQRCQT